MKEHNKKQSIWIWVSCYGSNLFWDCRSVAVVSLLTPGQHEWSRNGKLITWHCSALFSTVLYLRILEVNENFSLISNNQIGFLKGYRTADHVLFIDTVINEIVHRQRKRLFVAFVDLKKAYDKVNRKFMINKLRNKGFSGKFLKIIEAMLNNVTQIPKINGYFLSPILLQHAQGLKQGDNLSPILFDIFFGDIEDIFDENCDPVSLSCRWDSRINGVLHWSTPWSTFGALLEYFWGTFGALLEYFWGSFAGTSGVLLEYFWSTSGVLLGHFWGSFGALLEYFWSTFGVLLEHFWGTFGVLLEYFWSTFGALLEYFWSTFGVLLVHFSGTFGVPLEYFWYIFWSTFWAILEYF